MCRTLWMMVLKSSAHIFCAYGSLSVGKLEAEDVSGFYNEYFSLDSSSFIFFISHPKTHIQCS